MEPDPATGHGQVQALFRWNTLCEHTKNSAYPVFFKAKDDASPVNLVTIKSMTIRVIGPSPKNLSATPSGNSIALSWDPYGCANATGFYIYRNTDSTGYEPGYCETGVPPGLGYTKIAEINDISQTVYLDDNEGTGLIRGIKYCYMITAWFSDLAESHASNEACASLKKDVAVITNVSVNTTSKTNGSIFLAWSKPTELDTIQAPGPYIYVIARSRSETPGQFVRIDSLNSLNDTLYTDSLLNTLQYAFIYRIDLYNRTPGNHYLIGSSRIAASMYLTITPTDKQLKLHWTNHVPWINDQFVIYRKGPGGAGFDSVGVTTTTDYPDQGLINGLTYCYRIKSSGKYSGGGFIHPILNFSQENCSTPVDNIAPCPPLLTVTTQCDESQNTLSWTYPADTCPHDIAKYCIYYSPEPGNLSPIDSLTNPNDTVYIHKPIQSIVGCYAVAAVDSVGNRSAPGNIVCVDNTACSVYSLPNVFSPNGDGFNDLFHPFPYTSVTGIDCTIFDRWGKAVFKTKDPDINWDGKDKTTNQPCSDGTYFFVCDLDEITLHGTVRRSIQGSLTILR